MAKSKEIFKLYSVKYDAIKEYYRTFEIADKVVIAHNGKELEVKFMERADHSVYSTTEPVEE